MEEFEDAWQEFFKDKPEPSSEEESLEHQHEFVHWYNTERKQSDTGLTPEEMGDGMLEFSIEEPCLDLLGEANICLDQGMYDEAKEMIKDVLESEPDNRDALFLMVQANLMEGNFEEAYEILDEWEEHFPNDPYKYIQLAQVHITKLDFRSALESIDKALDTDPDLFEAVITKAQILSFMEDERYEGFIEKAKEIDEERTERFLKECWIDDAVCYAGVDTLFDRLNRVFSLMESGDTKEATELIRKIKVDDLTGELEETLYRLEHEILMLEGRDEEVEERLKDNPNDLISVFYSAQLAYSRGNTREALDLIDECISIVDEDEVDPLEYYSFKAEISRSIGDDEWKKWDEKARKRKEESLNVMKEEFDKIGIPFESDIGVIDSRGESTPPNRKCGDKDDKKERKKTLDEFL